MAERLTEKHKISCFEYDLVNFEHKVKEFNDYDAFYAYNMAVRKLGKLEDILEKYGIESVEELDKKLAYYIDKIDLEAENEYLKKVIEKQNMISKIISKNRDTWKRACELACKHIAEVEWLSCPETDDISESENEIKTLTKQSLNYFYQQAKKEKDGENNDTNN